MKKDGMLRILQEKHVPQRIFNDYSIQAKNPSEELECSDDIFLDLIVTYSISPVTC